MVYLKNVDHLHRCPLFLRNSYPHFQLCKACLFMDHVINEMEKNVQESLLLSEIIFTSVLPQAITVSSPEFWNSEFFLHQIKSKIIKTKQSHHHWRENILSLWNYAFVVVFWVGLMWATLGQFCLFLITQDCYEDYQQPIWWLKQFPVLLVIPNSICQLEIWKAILFQDTSSEF